MKNVLKGLMIAAAATTLGGLLLATAYTHEGSEDVTQLRRESRSDIVYLRTRVKELESELAAELANREPSDDLAVDGVIEEDTRIPESEADETESDTVAEDETGEEAVTVPTHMSPETQEPVGDDMETVAPVAQYVIGVYNGMIGVFDASGELVRTINVFVMTLPKAEQEALAVGIPAYSYEEMCRIAEQYE